MGNKHYDDPNERNIMTRLNKHKINEEPCGCYTQVYDEEFSGQIYHVENPIICAAHW